MEEGDPGKTIPVAGVLIVAKASQHVWTGGKHGCRYRVRPDGLADRERLFGRLPIGCPILNVSTYVLDKT
jgi:hypothetical protein